MVNLGVIEYFAILQVISSATVTTRKQSCGKLMSVCLSTGGGYLSLEGVLLVPGPFGGGYVRGRWVFLVNGHVWGVGMSWVGGGWVAFVPVFFLKLRFHSFFITAAGTGLQFSEAVLR